MRERIKAELLEIERAENVQIFYACESGSRAWGFPSADSDYDVRFLYVRPREWYLSIDVERKRDVIERPITDELDINGWDIRKALALLKKSNPPLLEWLNSPIVYQEKFDLIKRIKNLLPDYYSPTACLYHYLQMARGNYGDYLRGDTVRVKKYFYVLRPLLAIKWLEAGKGIVPVEFDILVENMVQDAKVKNVINDLIQRKRDGAELDREPPIFELSEFIKIELERIESKIFNYKELKPTVDKLNEVFRTSLDEAWQC